MRRAVCPGSFDPVTHGHLDIVERTVNLFDEVIVAVGNNMSKSGIFTPDERVEMLEEACAQWPGVTVTLFDGLLVEFCRQYEVTAIVKGLRFASDFDYELQMAQMNNELTGIETIFMPTASRWSYLSSSLIREIAVLGGDVSPFLTPEVAGRTIARVAERKGSPTSG